MRTQTKVAAIAAGAAIAAALIPGIFSLFTKSDQILGKKEPVAGDTVALLKVRADDVLKGLDDEIKEMDDIGLQASREISKGPGKTSGTTYHIDDKALKAAWDIAHQLNDLKKEFLDLHRKHIEALANGESTLTHELNSKIQALLHGRHDKIFYDAGVVVKDPGLSYMNGWKEIRIGSQKATKVDPRLYQRYPDNAGSLK